MKKTLFEDVLILNAIRLARLCVRCLPLGVCLALGRGVGSLTYVLSKRRRIAYKNLRMAFAGEKSPRELKRIARASFQNLGMSGVEMLRIPEMTMRDVEKYYRIEGKEHFEPYVQRKQGVLFLTGHFGSWELLNIVGGLMGYSMTALARIQKHPRSDAYLNSLRRAKGGQVIHKGMPMREILRSLKKGQIVGILSDQDGGKAGRFVEFFGRSSSTPAGAATFSIRTHSPLFPAFIIREKGAHHRIVIEKPVATPPEDLPEAEAETRMLQEFATALESYVRRYPEQWLWAHRRWKSSPDRNVLILSDQKAGHVQQSLAVLEALRRQRASQGFAPERLVSKTVEVRFRGEFHKKIWKAMGLLFRGAPPFSNTLLRWALEKESAEGVMDTYADIVISCGASLAEVNLWVKHENGAKSMVVMKPSLPARSFDAVIVPKHDGLAPADNIFETDGALSRLRPEEMAEEAEKWALEMGLLPGTACLGLLVGGDTAELKFDPASFEKMMREVQRIARSQDAKVLLTTSRRTPVWAETLLKEIFSQRDLCPLRVIANEANRPGVVAAILGLSDAVMVSGESMSMVSESVTSGKPVLVFHPCQTSRLKKKYQDLLGRWQQEKKVVVAGPDDLSGALVELLSAHAERPFTGPHAGSDHVLSEAARRVF